MCIKEDSPEARPSVPLYTPTHQHASQDLRKGRHQVWQGKGGEGWGRICPKYDWICPKYESNSRPDLYQTQPHFVIFFTTDRRRTIFFVFWRYKEKSPACGRHWISQLVRIVATIPENWETSLLCRLQVQTLTNATPPQCKTRTNFRIRIRQL